MEEGLRAVEKRSVGDSTLQERNGMTPEALMALLMMCLRTSRFNFHRKIYQFADGLATGSPVSPPVANLLMADFETEAFKYFPEEPPVSGSGT